MQSIFLILFLITVLIAIVGLVLPKFASRFVKNKEIFDNKLNLVGVMVSFTFLLTKLTDGTYPNSTTLPAGIFLIAIMTIFIGIINPDMVLGFLSEDKRDRINVILIYGLIALVSILSIR